MTDEHPYTSDRAPRPDQPHPAAAPGPPKAASGGGMAVRHVLSLVVALVLTPIGLLVFDLGYGRYAVKQRLEFQDTPVAALIVLLIGTAILCAVAALSRVSALGPLAAGLIWGGIPALWHVVDPHSMFRATRELPTVWDHGFWFSAPLVIFPLVAALLVGAAVGGRWAARPARAR